MRKKAADHTAATSVTFTTIQPIDAGVFGTWLEQMRAALRGTGGTDVPCGDCVGCCVSSYHIPIRPHDRAVLEQVPIQHLRKVNGQWLMGYEANGHCAMLHAGQCHIYSQRPQTCRDYDCRVFAAAGLMAGGAAKEVINQRVRAWRFSYSSEDDAKAHRAVQRAAAFIHERHDCFACGQAPSTPTGIAVLALKTYAVFLASDIDTQSDAHIAAAIIAVGHAFDVPASDVYIASITLNS